MTATMHIGRRTTPHHNPLTALAHWIGAHLRRRTADVDFEAIRRTYPVDHVQDYRHLLEDPRLEAAFYHLADSRPADADLTEMRAADHEVLLRAQLDAQFRRAHPAPEHRWTPQEIAAYEALMGTVHRHQTGGAS